jgi:hypothetical protein
MFIKLSDDLLPHLDFNDFATQDALENIATCFRAGKHLVTGSRGVLEFIIDNYDSAPRTIAAFKQMKNEIPQLGLLSETMSYIMEVVPVGLGIEEIYGKKILKMPLTNLHNSSVLEPTQVIGEDLTDLEFYSLVASAFLYRNRMPSVKIRHEPVNGGGSTTGTVYRHHQDLQERLCLCIVDSDKKSPGEEIHDTAKAVIGVNAKNKPLSDAIVVDVHEMENFLSCNQLKLLPPAAQSAVDDLINIRKTCVSEVGRYIDFKKGLTLKSIYTCPQGHPYRQFWEAELDSVLTGASYPRETSKSPCLHTNNCEESDLCTCVVFSGFGDHVLETVLSKMKEMSVQKVHESVCSYTLADWEDLGQYFVSWCCGRERMVV